MEEYPDLKIGDRVIRGPDWEWGDQDGFEENMNFINFEGTVISEGKYKGLFRVLWDCSLLNNVYRYDNEKHDIILYVKSKPMNLNPINYNPKPFFNFNFDLITI